jgi:hypothetical protein
MSVSFNGFFGECRRRVVKKGLIRKEFDEDKFLMM